MEFTPSLCNICQWMAVTCQKSLDQLFKLEFDRFVLTSPYISSRLVKALLLLAVAVQNIIASTPH
jgi:hypothetical protein